MSRTIPLIPDGEAVVDDVDYESLSKFKWFHWKCAGRIEVCRNNPGYGNGTVTMRRQLLELPVRHNIAFINGDRLDHRRENLIVVPHGGGKLLAKKREGGFFGVYARKNGRFYASKRLPDGTLKHIGSFDDEGDAAAAYDLFAVRHFGRAAVLNFPEDIEAYIAMVREEQNA
jgi:hypothetical protein